MPQINAAPDGRRPNVYVVAWASTWSLRSPAWSGLGLVTLPAFVETEIAQLSAEEQPEFLESLGFAEPASHRFIRAAGKIHSDIERGFIRAEGRDYLVQDGDVVNFRFNV